MVFHDPLQKPSRDNVKLEIIYNSKHGLLINNQFLAYSLVNATTLYVVLTNNSRMLYLAVDGLTFADIIHSQSLSNITTPLKVTFDSRYSDALEMHDLHALKRIPSLVKS